MNTATKPLNVMILGLRGFPNVQGGVETHVQHLSLSLKKLGCNVEVIVRSPYQPTEIGSEWNGIKFHPIWAPRSKALEAIVHTFLGVLYAAIKRPDILHIQAIGPSLMTPLSRLLGLRVVVTHHGPDYERQKWGKAARFVLLLGERFGMRYSNARIVISEVIQTIVRRKHNVESALIPNGVNLPDLPGTKETLNAYGLESGRYVLLVSRLVPEKRHHDLIQAFSQAMLSGWKLVLVGDSDHPDDYTRSVFDAARTVPNVICTGFQTGLALQELYAHAGIFVLPSSHEGLPIALLEALSYGLPVIASDIPANLEVSCDGIKYYPLGNISLLTSELQKQAAEGIDDEQRKTLRQFILKKYNWNAVAQKTYGVYMSIK